MTLEAKQITAIIDTREQLPLDLRLADGTCLPSVRGTLSTADYSICGLTDFVAFERKSLDDLAACCGTERKRFEAELQRMLAYRTRGVIVEASWACIELHKYRSRIEPQAVIGSILAWMTKGIPFILAGDRVRASEYMARMLLGTAKGYWRQTAEFRGAIIPKPKKKTRSRKPIAVKQD